VTGGAPSWKEVVEVVVEEGAVAEGRGWAFDSSSRHARVAALASARSMSFWPDDHARVAFEEGREGGATELVGGG